MRCLAVGNMVILRQKDNHAIRTYSRMDQWYEKLNQMSSKKTWENAKNDNKAKEVYRIHSQFYFVCPRYPDVT